MKIHPFQFHVVFIAILFHSHNRVYWANQWLTNFFTSLNKFYFILCFSISFFRRNFIYSISCLLHLHEIHYYFLDICYAELWAILHAVSQSHEKDPKVKTVNFVILFAKENSARRFAMSLKQRKESTSHVTARKRICLNVFGQSFIPPRIRSFQRLSPTFLVLNAKWIPRVPPSGVAKMQVSSSLRVASSIRKKTFPLPMLYCPCDILFDATLRLK